MRSEKVAERVARQIVRDMIGGSIEAGSALPSETEMLGRYNVGRASLREALRILEVTGIITIRPGPGGGPIVSALDPAAYGQISTLFFQMRGARLADLVDVRLLIEPVSVRLAAMHATPAQLETLMAAVSAADPETVEDSRTWLSLSTDFHGQVTSMSGNPILDLFAQAIKAIYTQRVRALVFPPEDRGRIAEAHRSIAEAICDRDPDLAERLMKEHMQDYVGVINSRFDGLMSEIVDWR